MLTPFTIAQPKPLPFLRVIDELIEPLMTVCMEYRDTEGDSEENIIKELILYITAMCGAPYVIQDTSSSIMR